MISFLFSQNNGIKIGIAVIFILSFVPLNAQTTISSTATGGKWNETTTWVGGTIPTANHHVVINGTVYINGTFSCMNLTINSNAELYNDLYSTVTFTVNGNLLNNGKISTHPTSGYRLSVSIKGNVENNGLWTVLRTSLSGSSHQYLKQGQGKQFEGEFDTTDDNGDIILSSDIVFVNNSWDLKSSRILTNGHRLITRNYHLKNGFIISNDHLELNNTIITSLTFEGNYKLSGKLRIQNGIVFKGQATLLDTLHNDIYSTTTLVIQGKMFNEGYLITHPASGYRLSVDIWGDIENAGVWAPLNTTLKANTDQKISQASGKKFLGSFAKGDSLGLVVLASDVVFENNSFELANATIKTNGYLLQTNNYTLKNGKIQSNERILLNNTILSNITFTGTYKLDGKIKIQNGIVFKGHSTLLDTLHNDTYFTTTLDVQGIMINEGYLITHPASGYRLSVNIWDNLENKGVWAPLNTTLKANTDQKISQSSGKKFLGSFAKGDSLGLVVLASDVVFENNSFELAKATIKTNGYLLQTNNYTLSNGNILCNDSLFFNDTKLSGINIKGNFVLKGKIKIQNNNTFEGNVTLADSLFNDYYYSSTLKITGNLINEGYLLNHPGSGYRLSLRINGNIVNNKILSINAIYLNGSNERNIGGQNPNGIQTTFYVEDPIVLTGTNTLPNLNFTSNPGAGCTVKKDAILILHGKTNSSRIKNYGRVSISHDLNNTWTTIYDFYHASASVVGNPGIQKLTVDHYGFQQHPTATGTVNTWWRLRSSPVLENDSLNWLRLYYSDESLNGNNEDSIMIFHSRNSGLTWRRIRTNYTLDKNNKYVSIPKAPSSGHYLLTSSALGVTSFMPMVETAEPRYGGNSGRLTMYLFGAGFKPASMVKLKGTGGLEILADTTYLTDGIGESMLSQFNLKNYPIGVYDVVVETPGEMSIELPGYFTIMPGERSDPWSSLAGRDRFLLNRWSTFNLSYGNTANTDALGNILVFVINDLPGLEVEFPDVNIILPTTLIEMGSDFTRFRDALDIYYVSDSLSGFENQPMRIYPFYIPYIAAGSSKSVRVRVKVEGQGSLKMDSWLLDPLYEVIDYNLKSAEPMPSEVRACITAAAMKAWYGGALGLGASVIPGLACWSVIDKTIDPIGYITPDELKPEEKQTWGSWLWKGVSIMGSAVQCGASFVPVVGTAVSLGIGLVNMTIDMKDGYDATEGCWRKFRKKSQSKLNSAGVSSFDPNEKAGPQGYTKDRYISREGKLNYTIFFENLKTAGASALEVFITDTLDITKFDFNTFSFHTIAFADTSLKIQDYAKEFKILVDLYPEKDILLQVHGKLDTLTGIVKWSFHSLDRLTMELTEDPDGGFLPPNTTSPQGEGHVTFSCELKNTVQHGDMISNKASIVFDLNAPIITNTYINHIDDKVPFSMVAPLALVQEDSIFTVSWSGSDMGSQIANYNIFVSVNDSAYVLWKVANRAGDAGFIGKNGYNYKFFSVATDSIGFAEKIKTGPEAVTTVSLNTGLSNIDSENDLIQVYPNPAEKWCNVSMQFTKPTEVEISIIDMVGRTHKRIEKIFVPSGIHHEKIDLIGFNDGIYLVKVAYEDKMLYRKLTVKKIY
jgi:cytoskeletal protein CcmA (bactofilin family)